MRREIGDREQLTADVFVKYQSAAVNCSLSPISLRILLELLPEFLKLPLQILDFFL